MKETSNKAISKLNIFDIFVFSNRILFMLTCTHAFICSIISKMAQTFQQEYMQMPPITRAYTTACVLTTLAVVRQLFVNNGIRPISVYCSLNVF